MKRFCLVFVIIWSGSSGGADAAEFRQLRLDDCYDPPCPPTTNAPSPRANSQQNAFADCLLCYSPQCVNCPKRYFQSYSPCPPCASPPCPPCLKSEFTPPVYFSTSPIAFPTFHPSHYRIRRSLRMKSNESTPEECSPVEIEAIKNELIVWTEIALRKACSHRYLRPSYSPVSVACYLRDAGYSSYIREYLPEVLGYLYRHFLLPRNAFQPLFVVRTDASGQSVVVPNPRRIFCPLQD